MLCLCGVVSALCAALPLLGAALLRRCIHRLVWAMASKKSKSEGIFATGYWDRPPLAQQGDADGSRIYAAVGSALSAWEGAEEALASYVWFSQKWTT
jgi:hypothetical protein